MEVDPASSTPVDVDIALALDLGKKLIQSILDKNPIQTIRSLIVDESAPLWYQDPDEGGISALHAAVYMENRDLVQLLIEKGAMWNAMDALNNTAADIALSMNNAEIYEVIRNAGIRSEMLLTLLSSQSKLESTESALILKSEDETAAGSLETFLSSRLTFQKDVHGQDICLVHAGEQQVGVMMGWERQISELRTFVGEL
jgi:protein arginine N-methyltransferase 2